MKTRKILALVMAIALLAISMSVVASAAGSISNSPDKLVYTDIECFDPTGLVITDGTGATVS